LLFGIIGCSSSTATVSGKVYLDDKPLKGGRVVFISTQGKGSASTDIEEDGSYKITKAPVGRAKITVATEWMNPRNQSKARKYEPPPGQKSPYRKEKEEGVGARYIKIPDEYEEPDKTPLTFEVKGGNQPFDIKLSSSGGAGK
jgi:hypothetical protein